jgi:methyl-accepting chemotaxis protein
MKSLSTRLTIFLAVILAASGILLTTFAYLNMRHEVLAQLEREVNAVGEQQNYTISGWIAAKRRVITATLPALFEADVRPILQRAAIAGDFTNVYVAYPDGRFIQSMDTQVPAGFDPKVRPWYKAATQRGALVVTAPFMSVTDRKLVVSVAAPVTRNGQTAIISSNVLLDDIVSGILNTKLAGDSHAFLMTRDGTLMAHRDSSALLKPISTLIPDLRPERIEALGASHELVPMETSRGTQFVSLRKVPDSDWYFGLVIDRDAVLAPLSTLMWVMLGTTLVLLVVSVVLARFGIRKLLAGLAALRDALTEISRGAGDLTARLPVRSNDEVGQAATAFNHFLEQLHSMFRDVREQVTQVNEEVGSVAATTSRITQDFVRQTDELSATAATIEEVTVSIGHIAETVRETEAAMQTADSESTRSAESVGQVTREIVRIAETMGGLSSVVSRLGSRSDEIAGIVGAIKDIADQTNLLALNAAIEAARAGEQGRGFAVVADEVRKLAERTAEATVEIGRMIDSIRSEMTSAVTGMDDAQRIVSSGVGLAEQATEGIRNIQSRVSDVMVRIRDISGATSEQASATSEMAKRSEQVHAMIEESSDALHATERMLTSVDQRAERLGQIVGRFRL